MTDRSLAVGLGFCYSSTSRFTRFSRHARGKLLHPTEFLYKETLIEIRVKVLGLPFETGIESTLRLMASLFPMCSVGEAQCLL